MPSISKPNAMLPQFAGFVWCVRESGAARDIRLQVTNFHFLCFSGFSIRWCRKIKNPGLRLVCCMACRNSGIIKETLEKWPESEKVASLYLILPPSAINSISENSRCELLILLRKYFLVIANIRPDNSHFHGTSRCPAMV